MKWYMTVKYTNGKKLSRWFSTKEAMDAWVRNEGDHVSEVKINLDKRAVS